MCIKRILKVTLFSIVVLLIIGLFCYMNISPLDSISGATVKNTGLQESGAITHIINGEKR